MYLQLGYAVQHLHSLHPENVELEATVANVCHSLQTFAELFEMMEGHMEATFPPLSPRQPAPCHSVLLAGLCGYFCGWPERHVQVFF